MGKWDKKVRIKQKFVYFLRRYIYGTTTEIYMDLFS